MLFVINKHGRFFGVQYFSTCFMFVVIPTCFYCFTFSLFDLSQSFTVTFLFSCVGGRIDHAHHYNNPYRALDETLELETALLAALERVNPAETLIVVTADHGHVMTFGGQATPRGHPVLGNKLNRKLKYIIF